MLKGGGTENEFSEPDLEKAENYYRREEGLNSYSHPKAQLTVVDNMAEEVDGGSRDYGDFSDHASRWTRRANTTGWGPILNISSRSKKPYNTIFFMLSTFLNESQMKLYMTLFLRVSASKKKSVPRQL